MDVRKIVIIGGVAGGASAATRARRMDENAQIIMLEQDEHVSFANCGLPYHIGGEIPDRDSLLIASPETFKERFKIDVRTFSRAIAIDRVGRKVHVKSLKTGDEYALSYDKLIIATGASPVLPSMEGVHAPNVFTLRNMEDMDQICSVKTVQRARRALVVGAGYVGLEMVEQLQDCGMEVSLVELKDQVLPLLDREIALPIAHELERRGVQVFTGRSVVELVREKDTRVGAAILSDGTRIATDIIIFGIGVRPNSGLAREAGLALHTNGAVDVDAYMRTSDPDIYAVGDVAVYPCALTESKTWVPLAGPANRAGRLAGEHAATGRSLKMPAVAGTSIVRVFGRNAGITGLSEKRARGLGISADTVTIVAANHASYFPGSELITLKLVYDRETGRVLGLQGVGREGVDKRLDVAATAIAAGMTVDQLAGVDLAYAPPFGSAKDPIHMAAFAASNQMAGLVRFAPYDASLEGLQVIDVRSQSEREDDPLLCQHIGIPVCEIRARMHELDPLVETVVVCAVGKRSYVAARILNGMGMQNVSTLSGGQTLRRLAS